MPIQLGNINSITFTKFLKWVDKQSNASVAQSKENSSYDDDFVDIDESNLLKIITAAVSALVERRTTFKVNDQHIQFYLIHL